MLSFPNRQHKAAESKMQFYIPTTLKWNQNEEQRESFICKPLEFDLRLLCIREEHEIKREFEGIFSETKPSN